MTVIDSREIFDDYGYFSSYSKHWLDHCEDYAEQISKSLSLNQEHLVIELASNDGYMLKNFSRKECGFRIDPAKNVQTLLLEMGLIPLSIILERMWPIKLLRKVIRSCHCK